MNKNAEYSECSDEVLLGLSSKGDKLAFEMLYDRYFDKLVWFARGFVKNTPQAEDLVQEAFIKIIERPELFETGARFSTWIYTVTSNQCKQWLRNTKNRARILEENFRIGEAAIGEGVRLDNQFLKQKVSGLITALSEKERNIYVMRFEEEMQIKDIASLLEIPEGSVKSCIYYLLKKLATHLKEFKYEN